MFAKKFAFIDPCFPDENLFVLRKGGKIEQILYVEALFGDWLEILQDKFALHICSDQSFPWQALCYETNWRYFPHWFFQRDGCRIDYGSFWSELA